LTDPEKNVVEKIRVQSSLKHGSYMDCINEYIHLREIKTAILLTRAKSIPSETFRNLRHIHKLSIVEYQNYFEFKNFHYLSDLTYLSVWDSLKGIKRGAFMGLKNLVWLVLQHCELSKLEEGCFDGLDNLKVLILEAKKLKHIPEKIFANLKNLVVLKMSFSGI
jgi:hypothetical protein